MRLPLGILALLISACLVGAPTVHAQAAAEYGGAAGVSAGAVASKPQLFNPGAGPAAASQHPAPRSARPRARPRGHWDAG